MNNSIKLSNIFPINNLQDFKTHFAIWNGHHHPLDVFARNPKEWLEWNAYILRENFWKEVLITRTSFGYNNN